MFFILFGCCVVVSTSASDCQERVIFEVICCVSSGTLNSTQYSLTVCACLCSAFAELQIDMSEVANDILSSSGLPFRDCTNYSVRVLFASDKWQSYVVTEYVSCSLLELLGKGWLGVLFLQTAQMQSLHLINYILYLWLDSIMIKALVGWLSGRTSVSDRRTFTGLHRTCSWWVTIYIGKLSVVGQPTRPTQPFILTGSINV